MCVCGKFDDRKADIELAKVRNLLFSPFLFQKAKLNIDMDESPMILAACSPLLERGTGACNKIARATISDAHCIFFGSPRGQRRNEIAF